MSQVGNAVDDLLKRLHECEGLNPPARTADLARLSSELAAVPDREALVALYRDHDGSNECLEWGGVLLGARLTSIGEALYLSERMEGVQGELPDDVMWLFTDDNSNYAGIFTTGPLAGFVTLLVHDDPRVAPRFRSVLSFMNAILDGSVGDDPRCDIPDVVCELPVARDDATDLERFRELAADALARWRGLRGTEAEEAGDLRRVWAAAALCLLPVADTNAALELLDDPDMWIPEYAAALLEVRNFHSAIPQLERLAREGTPNGYSAAMRALVRFGTPESEEAVARLEKVLKGQKLAMLRQWRRDRPRLLPPEW